MDLAQYPPRRVGSPNDPLADPYDDPSYSFSYRTPDSSRTENSDSTGRVRGLYSYLDDIGERHSVRYAAGAGTGFEISNAVPDNPVSVGYNAPLYKSHPKARGKMTVQRGPNGSYKLIAAGPDHRRAESRGPDGLVRGTYSYLDDKGVQRTVEYIAGAGIGYRILQNSMGPGSHINPSVADFRLTDSDFKLANEFGSGADGGLGLTGGGADSNNRRVGSGSGSRGNVADAFESSRGDSRRVGNGNTAFVDNGDASNLKGKSGSRDGGGVSGTRGDGLSTNGSRGSANRIKSDRKGSTYGGSRHEAADSSTGDRGGSRTSGDRNVGAVEERSRGRTRYRDRNRGSNASGRRGGNAGSSSTPSSSSSHGGSGAGYNYDPPSSSNNYNFNDDEVGPLPPFITANRKILEIDRERDWVERNRDSTVIKNVGKWYIGLPPGQSVRAHVQNIDLLPLGARRVPSPSEALRQDEIAEMVASLESGSSYVS